MITSTKNTMCVAALFLLCFIVAYCAGMRLLAVAILIACITCTIAFLLRDNMKEHFGDMPRKDWIYDYVDGVYCILLTKRKQRVNNAMAFFNGINVKPTYIDAIDKNMNLDIDSMLNDCTHNGVCKLIPKYTLTRGEIACYVSHLKALRTFLEDVRPDGKRCETCIVCEDDVKPIESGSLPMLVNKFVAVMNETKGVPWNVINLGPCITWCDARRAVDNSAVVYDGELSSSKCSHFIVVNRAGAQTILDNAFPIFNIPYDVKLNVLARQGRIKMLEADVPIVSQNRERLRSELDHDDELVHCVSVNHPKNEYLVFGSIGDQSKWFENGQWGGNDRLYDLYIAYYGSDVTKIVLSSMTADRFFEMKGGKFQNLYALYQAKPEFFNGYKYIAVLDDDIDISSTEINIMFQIAEKLDLWICQPSFTDDSKISHDITRHENGISVAYTNLIEMNCPFFNASKLFQVLNSDKNDGTLYGYGTDYMYQDILGDSDKKYAIIHSVQCRNPEDHEKPDGREILKLASQETRVGQWNAYAQRFNLNSKIVPTVHSCVEDGTGLPMPSYCVKAHE